MSQALITRLLAARESWFELAPGKRLKLRRPAETEMAKLLHGIGPEQLRPIVVGWEGFTEADLLGPAVGGDSMVPFDAEVCSLVLADRAEWFGKACQEVQRLVLAHLEAKVEAQKNSLPS